MIEAREVEEEVTIVPRKKHSEEKEKRAFSNRCLYCSGVSGEMLTIPAGASVQRINPPPVSDIFN
jgi:hypothetical protein